MFYAVLELFNFIFNDSYSLQSLGHNNIFYKCQISHVQYAGNNQILEEVW